MKKSLQLKIIFLLAMGINCIKAQIISIQCYNQNARVLTDTNNLILNGGFENTTCIANGAYTSCFCPNSQYYNCSISNWICTGGGYNTYACVIDTACLWSNLVEGTKAVYFGNRYAHACSTGDTSCISHIGCEIMGIQAGYPVNTQSGYGGDTGLILSQSVNGLTIGSIYILEFWVGGEHGFLCEGLFAVNLGFGNIFLRDPPTEPYSGIGTRYVIAFSATSSSHTIKFTNWGHISSPYCTELVLDDVRLFPDTALSLPSAHFTSSDTTFCSETGKCINFFDHSTGNPTSWHWHFFGATPDSSNLQNPDSICYSTPGSYPVTLIVSNGTSTDTLTVSPLIIFGTSVATPTITIRGGDTIVSSHGSTYQWYLNGIAIAGATDSFYVEHQNGTYSVQISDNTGGCHAISGGLPVGVIELSGGGGITIFPNPFDEAITILAKGREPLEIIIYDIASRPLMQKKFTGSATLNIENLAKGVYLYEVRNENGVVKRGKMVKE